MFKAGDKYDAKLVEAGLTNTKSGDAQAFMKFECSTGGVTESFYWHGSFKSDKSTALTIKALLTAGFAGDDASDLEHGLLKFMPKNIMVELEDNQGKLRVKWVNAPSKAKPFTGVAPKLAGAFAKAKAELGIKNEPNW